MTLSKTEHNARPALPFVVDATTPRPPDHNDVAVGSNTALFSTTPWRSWWWVWVCVFGFFLTLSLLRVGIVASGLMPTGSRSDALTFSIAALAWAAVLWLALGGRQRLKAGEATTAAKGRLQLLGPVRMRDAVLARCHPDAAFEPVVVRSLESHRFGNTGSPGEPGAMVNPAGKPGLAASHRGERWVRNLIAITLIACLILLSRTLRSMGWTVHIPIDIVTILACALPAIMAVSWLRPTFLRVAPGVLDVLEFDWGARKIVRCERYDLRTATLVIDVDKGWARIYDASRATLPNLHLSLMPIVQPRTEFFAALLRAARTRHPTPPLPTDALVG